MRIQPTAQLGIDRAQIARMHDRALELAERVGMRVHDEVLLERLRGKSGFTIREHRIYPTMARMEAFVTGYRARHAGDAPPSPDAQPIYFVSDRPLYTLADDNHTMRPCLSRDIIDGAKLVEVLYDRGVRGGVTGLPADVDPLLAPFEQIRISLRYGRGGGYSSHGFTVWHAKYMAQITRAMGHDYGLGVWMPSPFRLEGNELEIALALEGQYATLGVGSMPLMGITAPMNEVKTWVQALAETIGAATILEEAFPGVAIDIFPHPKPADLRTGNYGCGSPEWHLLDVLKMAILPFYGSYPPWGKSMSPGAAVPGAQAQAECMAGMVIGFLHGYRMFDMMGMLAGDEVFSPAQLLLDLDTAGWAERYARGIAIEEDDDIERWIALADADALFAEDPDEVARMREVYYLPRYLAPATVGQHETSPANWMADAHADAQRLIATHQYEPDAALLRTVDDIIDHARNHPPSR